MTDVVTPAQAESQVALLPSIQPTLLLCSTDSGFEGRWLPAQVSVPPSPSISLDKDPTWSERSWPTNRLGT
jgi:hypothetical protein